MKLFSKILLVLLIVGITSCRDQKKEEAETQAVVEEVEMIKSESEAMIDQIESEAEELEEALQELDSI